MGNEANRGKVIQGVWGVEVWGIWAMRPRGGMGYRGMGHMGNRGYGVHGVWATWSIGHMANGAHGQRGSWAMGPMGHGAHGDWHILAYNSINTGWILTKILLNIDIDVFYLNTGRFFHDGLN